MDVERGGEREKGKRTRSRLSARRTRGYRHVNVLAVPGARSHLRRGFIKLLLSRRGSSLRPGGAESRRVRGYLPRGY